MASFGYSLMDSDDAQDRVTEELLKIKKGLSRKLRFKKREGERMGVAALVKRLRPAFTVQDYPGPQYYVELARDSIDSLQRMLDDESFISSWKDPSRIRSSLRRHIRELEKSIKEVRSRRNAVFDQE